ncbi:MAG: class I SAM-dependent RNA methyltransferase [Gemmatimonadota bacterium]
MSPSEAAASRPVEPLAHLEYGRELALKDEALAAFWEARGLPGRPEPVRASPRPRHYRTTTRRRARYRPGWLQLALGDGPSAGGAAVPASALEPAAHTAIYRHLAEVLSTPANRPVAAHLNHAIVRGSYEAFAVILNLDQLSGEIVRRLKVVAAGLQALEAPVVSAFAFCDPTRSDYYLERGGPPVPVRLKKLYGPATFLLRLAGRRYAVPPTCFSQVNESMVEPMLGLARELLRPEPGDRLLDLYCGYGLFSHYLSADCREVLGMDVDGEAVAAAGANLRFQPAPGRVTFTRAQIDGASLARGLPPPRDAELIVLDPPRQGTGAGVVPCLAARRPRRVVHILCGIEEIPAAVGEWGAGGYAVTRVAPLDMFPGTPNLETLLLLEPQDLRGPRRSRSQ